MSEGTLIIALVSLVAGGLLVWLTTRWWRRLRWTRRRARGRRGELQAVGLLEAAGYQVVESQARQTCEVIVDGVPSSYVVKADFLASRDGKTFVVEVKTGETAPDPTYTPTRRQLLEYFVSYAVEGALLVDMEAGVIHRIAWDLDRRGPVPGRGPGRRRLLGPLLLLALGAIAGWSASTFDGCRLP